MEAPGLTHQFLKLFGMGGIQNEAVDLLVLWGLISFFGVLGQFGWILDRQKNWSAHVPLEGSVFFQKSLFGTGLMSSIKNMGHCHHCGKVSSIYQNICTDCCRHCENGKTEISFLQYHRFCCLGVQHVICRLFFTEMDTQGI